MIAIEKEIVRNGEMLFENTIEIEIVRNAERLLEDMTEFCDEIMEELKPIESAILVATLEVLVEKVMTVQTKTDLLVLTDTILSLIEEVAGLRAFLLPEIDVVIKRKALRIVTPYFDRRYNQADLTYNVTAIRNKIVACHDLWARELSELYDLQASDAYRHELAQLWAHLKLNK